MRAEPGSDRGCLVGREVVADQVHVEVGGHRGVDLVEELLELHSSVSGKFTPLPRHSRAGTTDLFAPLDMETGLVIHSIQHRRAMAASPLL